MATTWGWLLGSFFAGVAVLLSGFMVAVFQWLVLQGRLSRPWHWILATSAGWLIGYFIAFFLLPEIFTGMIIGLGTGVAQWLILRREFRWAGWWIVFSLIGWTTGLTLFTGILITGIMAGALTGICLEVLLRYPKPKIITANPAG